MTLEVTAMAKHRLKERLFLAFGWATAIFWGLGAALSLGDAPELKPNLPVYGCFLLLGVALIVLGMRARRRRKRWQGYLTRLNATGDGSIKRLAEACALDEVRVKRELQWLIDRRYLTDARIDGQCVVWPRAGKTEEPFFGVAVCPGCGAAIHIAPGESGACRYCGAPIGG